MAVARTEPLPSGRWRGVATIEGRRVTRSFDTEGQALHWADVQMRAAAVAASRPKEPVSGEAGGGVRVRPVRGDLSIDADGGAGHGGDVSVEFGAGGGAVG